MRLEEIKALCEAATPGPWDYDGRFTVSVPGEWAGVSQSCFRIAKNDAAFIVEARALLPGLLAVANAAELLVADIEDFDGYLVKDLRAALAALERP